MTDVVLEFLDILVAWPEKTDEMEARIDRFDKFVATLTILTSQNIYSRLGKEEFREAREGTDTGTNAAGTNTGTDRHGYWKR